MQKEYDLTRLKVKRRGLLADLPPQEEAAMQVEVNLLLDKEVVNYFRATGAGWQSRMDEALKEWMREHALG